MITRTLLLAGLLSYLPPSFADGMLPQDVENLYGSARDAITFVAKSQSQPRRLACVK